MKPLVAHCRIILCHEDYTPKKGAHDATITTVDYRNAKRFAERILDHLCVTVARRKFGAKLADEILYGTGDHDDPGEAVSLEALWDVKDRLRS